MGARPLPGWPRSSVPSPSWGVGTQCALESIVNVPPGTGIDFPFPCMSTRKLEAQFQDAWACTKAVMMAIVWKMAHCGDGLGGGGSKLR